jgi:hypothetical protein
MKQATTKLYPVLWRCLKHDLRRTIATPGEMVRFGGKGRATHPCGFVVMTRSTSRREAVKALFGRGAGRQLAAR